MRIHFCDSAARFRRDARIIKQIVHDAGVHDRFILKDAVAAFETEVRRALGATAAVAVSSSTGGLTVALGALDVGRGDGVVTPALGSPAAANATVARGARPVFVDVDPVTGTLDPAAIDGHLTRGCRAIVAGHSLSFTADMAAVRRVASAHGLGIVEDAGGFFSATIAGVPAGRWGRLGVFSLSPHQPLGGIAEAAVIVSDDATLGTACRMLRNHGQDGVNRFHHHRVGYNSRMDELAGAYLSHRLRTHAEEIVRRAQIASQYAERLKVLDGHRIVLPPNASPDCVYPRYVIQADRREALGEFLARRGIETRIYGRGPLPSQPAFAHLAHASGAFPNAERLCRRLLGLPFHAELTDDHVQEVADAVLAYYDTQTGVRHAA